MKPSATIQSFMKGYEKFRARAYLPTPNDKWTIGYGETNGVKPGMVWTLEQAEQNFAARIVALGARVSAAIGNAPTTQGQFDAMVSLADNIGMGNFTGSSVLTAHRGGHYQTAAWAFGLWNKQRGSDGVLRPLAGLTKRRAAESVIYRNG